MKNDQKVNSVVESNLKTPAATNETDSKQSATETSAPLEGAPDAPLKLQQNMMETVGMSSGMKDKLAKEIQE